MENESSIVVLPKISNQSNPCDSDESDDKVTAIQNNAGKDTLYKLDRWN